MGQTYLHSEPAEEALDRAEAALLLAATREPEIDDRDAESLTVEMQAVAEVKELQKPSTREREVAVLRYPPDGSHQHSAQVTRAYLKV